MRDEGMRLLFCSEELTVMGLFELLPHLPRLAARLRQAAEAVTAYQPHVCVTVDYKGFNLRLQTAAGGDARRHAAVHVVAPSAWAWRGGRRRLAALRGGVDLFLCIVPFEPAILVRPWTGGGHWLRPSSNPSLGLGSGCGF